MTILRWCCKVSQFGAIVTFTYDLPGRRFFLLQKCEGLYARQKAWSFGWLISLRLGTSTILVIVYNRLFIFGYLYILLLWIEINLDLDQALSSVWKIMTLHKCWRRMYLNRLLLKFRVDSRNILFTLHTFYLFYNFNVGTGALCFGFDLIFNYKLMIKFMFISWLIILIWVWPWLISLVFAINFLIEILCFRWRLHIGWVLRETIRIIWTETLNFFIYSILLIFWSMDKIITLLILALT